MLALIVAYDRNRAIGRDNALLWHIPNDLKYFKQVTLGHPVIMGRKTYESIGRLLPGRENIILTRQTDWHVDGATVVHSLDGAMEQLAGRDAFIIGGANLYEQSLSLVDYLYVTEVDGEYEADAFFPQWDEAQFIEQSRTSGTLDEKNTIPHTFVVYKRRY